MTEMDSKLRDRLEDLAREVSVASTMPPSLPSRARRRAILTVSSVVLCAALVVVGAAAGVRSILRTDDREPFTGPTPTADRGRWARIAGWITYTDDQLRPTAIDPGTSKTEFIPLNRNRNIVAWSHDGTCVLVSVPHGDLFVENAAGASWQISSVRDAFGGASFSPDDTKFVYAELGSRSKALPSAILIADVRGNGQPSVIRKKTIHVAFLFPTWSPDGSQIAFLEGDERAVRSRLMVMNADGSDARSLLADARIFAQGAPVWSPDGSTIAFAGTEGPDEDGGVYTVRHDGSGLTKVAGIAGAASPAWSPDGTRLAFRAMPDDQLYVVDAAGGAPRPLGVFAWKDTTVLWISGSGTGA
jgi:Tol biopolymer transport system component